MSARHCAFRQIWDPGGHVHILKRIKLAHTMAEEEWKVSGCSGLGWLRLEWSRALSTAFLPLVGI